MNSKTRSTGKSTLLIALGIFLSRIFGFVRTRVFAHYLGNSMAAGAFSAALRIPNLLQNLFGEGVLSASFIPVYAKLMAEGKEDEARKLAGTVMTILTTLTCLMVGLGVLFTRPFTMLFAPGFTGEAQELTVRLVEILFPSCGFLVLSAWCLGVLNSHRKFFLSYVSPVIWNITIIATLVYFGANLSGSVPEQMKLVEMVAFGTVVGSLLQFLIQVPLTYKLNGGWIFAKELKNPTTKTVVKNFWPAFLARGVTQISAYIDQMLTSYLGTAAVAGMNYAQMLALLPVSLFGMSISSAELPELASAVGTPEEVKKQLRERLMRGVLRISFYVIPSSVAFILLGDVVTGIVYQTGNFARGDTIFVAWILAGSSVGLFASTQGRLCTSVFWALQDSKTPARFALLRVFLTGALGYLTVFPLRDIFNLEPQYAAAALSASAGVAGWIEFMLIRRVLTQRIGNFDRQDHQFLKTWIAAFIAAGICYAAKLLLPDKPLLIGIPILCLYGALYIGFALAFGLQETKVLFERIRRRKK